MNDTLNALLRELVAKLPEADRTKFTGLGLSLFLVNDDGLNPVVVEHAATFTGDLPAIGMFAPEWSFSLTRSLLDDGPTVAFEGEVRVN